MKSAALCFTIFLLTVQIAVSGTFHVAVHGSNGDGGTSSRPWKDIQHGINLMGAGDTLMIHQGIYQESLQMKKISGEDQLPIVIRNFPGDSVTVQSITSRGSDPALRLGGSYVQIKGIRFHKTTGSSGPVDVYGGMHVVLDSLEIVGPGSWDNLTISNRYGETAYIKVQNCKIHTALHEGIYVKSENDHPIHHLVFKNNEIYNCPDEAIQISGSYAPHNPPRDVIIAGNNIHHVGAWAIVHLYYAPKNVLIEGNFIHHNSTPWVGIHIDGAEAVCQNNIFSHNRGSNAEEDFACIRIGSSHGTPSYRIFNNTFGLTERGNASGAYGIWIGRDSGAESDTIGNNIFYNIEDAAIFSKERAANTVTHNLFYHKDETQTAVLEAYHPIVYTLVNQWKNKNVYSDPFFVNADSLNYNLQDNSPAINAGLTCQTATDYTGKTRINNSFDIGAYESDKQEEDVILIAPKVIRIINN